MTRCLATKPLLLSCALFAVGCGSIDNELSLSSLEADGEITAAISDADAAGTTVFYAAASKSSADSMTMCFTDATGNCFVAPVAMINTRTVGDRKIFRAAVQFPIQGELAVRIAVVSVAGTVERRLRLVQQPQGGGANPGAGTYRWKVVIMASDQ